MDAQATPPEFGAEWTATRPEALPHAGGAAPTLDVWGLWLPDPRLAARASSWLTQAERRAAERKHGERLRRHSIAARVAVRGLLAAYTGESPARLEFEQGEHGKPRLAGAPGLHFNLSHSADLGVLAVSRDGRVGVDVERCEAGRPVDRLAERWFAPEEHAAISMLDRAERVRRFYEQWTCKEAYLKAHGLGLTFSPRLFTVALTAEAGGARLETTALAGDTPQQWRLWRLATPAGFAGAVCWEGGALEPRLRLWDVPVR